jgi:hypothetical protein
MEFWFFFESNLGWALLSIACLSGVHLYHAGRHLDSEPQLTEFYFKAIILSTLARRFLRTWTPELSINYIIPSLLFSIPSMEYGAERLEHFPMRGHQVQYGTTAARVLVAVA